ncbi:Ribonuclease HII [Geodia barretti]|uniref:Ribonuclease n=1 Tax=Geodia barretti TaxID=519541 RepID=A0AA35XBN5_GEOBA|nr:Ribonuclease HII [Geodia barretti]
MPDLSEERRLHRQGRQVVAGVDEAGRGPLAGPVVAAAVVLPNGLTGEESWLLALDDSKRLSARQREAAFHLIQEYAVAVSVVEESPNEIDRIGIGRAVIRAMMRAVGELAVKPEHLLLDYVPIKECSYPFETLVKGDSRSYSIAAASIVAKVTRDRTMEEADELYPGYNFARNKGYGTAHHREQLSKLGPCPLHRRSFAPLRQAALILGD